MIFDKVLPLLIGILGLCLVVVQTKRLNATQQAAAFYPQPRILGGINSNDAQFPYQVSMREDGRHICGGSIITPNYIVTAAHCRTDTPASRLSVRAGSILVDALGQTVGVASVIKHPGYQNFDNDIALLKLSKPLQFNNRVKPIALACRAPPSGSKVVVSGWGRSSDGSYPIYLQYNTLTALTYDECSQRIARVPRTWLCLDHTAGNGVCFGDSGGPAVYQNQLVGVTNNVIGTCGTNNPDGFANIAVHYNWIKNNSDL